MSLLEISLGIQFLVLGMFITSLVSKWKKLYSVHATLMLVAVILYLVSSLLIPSWIFSIYTINEAMRVYSENFLVVAAFAIHSLLSGIFVFLTMRILISWRLRTNQSCLKNKKKMRHTVIMWISSYLTGLLLLFLQGYYLLSNIPMYFK